MSTVRQIPRNRGAIVGAEYIREHKEERPVLAICYDFDKTLSPDDMRAQGFIQSVGYDVGEFESNPMD